MALSKDIRSRKNRVPFEQSKGKGVSIRGIDSPEVIGIRTI
jgi:hypothetical protein